MHIEVVIHAIHYQPGNSPNQAIYVNESVMRDWAEKYQITYRVTFEARESFQVMLIHFGKEEDYSIFGLTFKRTRFRIVE